MRRADAVGELGLLDEHRRVACDLAQRRIGNRDHRRSRRHRLDDGEPESLVATRLDEARSAAVQLREARGVHVALEPRATIAELCGQCGVLLRTDDDEREPDGGRGLERGELVLAPLDGTDGEDVVPRTGTWREGGIDTVRSDDDSVGRRTVELDDVVPSCAPRR